MTPLNQANIIAIETSCDETSVAIFNDKLEVLSSVVASQFKWHERFGGVVPEVAARAHMELLNKSILQALQDANMPVSQISAVAVHNGPGLAGALLVGLSAAKMIALGLNVPLIAVNHVHSHIYACRMSAGKDIFPCVGMVVSGGHSILFECQTALEMKRLGGTIDDAAGEAFDKVAALLGLGFPGGPAVEREALSGNPNEYAFPKSFFYEDRLDFSFSGLKTAVLYTIAPPGQARPAIVESGKKRADIAASFQKAVVDVLVSKALQALKKTGLKRLAVGGGVVANQTLRQKLLEDTKLNGIELYLPEKNLCTDNAAMAALSVEAWKQNIFTSLDVDIRPTVF